MKNRMLFSFTLGCCLAFSLCLSGNTPGSAPLWSLACGQDFFDGGGANGNYVDYQQFTAVICPDQPGQYVEVTFSSFQTEACCDQLYVYDTNNDFSNHFASFSGNTLPPVLTANNPSGCLSFYFYPQGNVTAAGWEATVSCTNCPRPNNLSVTELGNQSALLNWNIGSLASAYDWELGLPGFLPDTGNEIISGTTGTNLANMNGLGANTDYEAYVRVICGGVDQSEWAGPIAFQTSPTCGDVYYDPGGADGNYPPNQVSFTTVCPPATGQFVAVTFQEFDLHPASFLSVLNGNSANAAILTTLTGNALPPTLNATSADGCLTFYLNSYAQETASGWEATVACVDCAALNSLLVEGITNASAILHWQEIAPATAYEWELGSTDFSPGTGTALASGVSMSEQAVISGLESATSYDAWLRVACQNGDFSAWKKVSFSTLPTCDDHFYDSGGANGNQTPYENYIQTLCPDVPGTYLSAAFEAFNLGPCCANMTIYDSEFYGTNTIGYYSGSGSPGVVTASNQSGCLTFHVYGGDVAAPGWDAALSCVTCPNPYGLQIDNPGLSSVGIAWLSLQTASYFAWEIVPEGAAPGTGAAAVFGNANTTSLFVTGLESGTRYELYVRVNCGGTEFSAFSGPVGFATSPTCGDEFFDTGGPNGNYPPFEDKQMVICPDAPGNYVSLSFDNFDMNACCAWVEVRDGQNYWDAPLGTFTGSTLPPTLTATNNTGCLHFRAYANGTNTTDSGFVANVACVTCPNPNNLHILNVLSTEVQFTWNEVPSANYYYWEVVPVGALPGTGAALDADFGSALNVVASGLSPGTTYHAYVRTHCINGDTSVFTGPVPFFTSPECGQNFYDPGGPNDDYPSNQITFTTICPDQPGTFVAVDFETFELSECCAQLDVFDGPSTNWGYLGTWYHNSPTPPNILTALNSTGCLTFVFNAYNGSSAPGWSATVECVTCPNPFGFSAGNPVGGGVQMNWTGLQTPVSYHWEVGLPGFTPGTGTAVSSGNTNDFYATANGLDGNTAYEAYVRTECSGIDYSTFTGPVSFSTTPTCGSDFFDPGGPNGDFPANQFTETRICPNQPGEYVQITFDTLDLDSCCASLTVNDFPYATVYLGNSVPEVVTSNASDGCVVIGLHSFADSVSSGWEASVACISCPYPNKVNLQTTGSFFLELNWNTVPSANSYYWELGLSGFTPTTGSAVAFGNTSDYLLTLSGLAAGTAYEFYVRTNCSNGETSSFAGPYRYQTAPTCGGNFYDPGGPNANYQTGIGTITVICPDVPGQALSATFLEFEIHPWEDYLVVYDGIGQNVNQLAYMNGMNMPGIFNATNPDGCLTFVFNPYSGQIYSGWDVAIECLACPPVFGLTVTAPSTHSVTLTWNASPTATNWQWEIGLPGFLPGTGTALFTGTSATNSILVEGLESGTDYQVYVRADCGPDGLGAFNAPVSFHTAPACGDYFYDSGGPDGFYNNYENAVMTICPDLSGQAVSVTFNYLSLESCCDYLYVYDGNSTSSPQIGVFNGGSLPPVLISTAPNGCLTFQFYSDGSATYPGWEALVECEGCSVPEGFSAANPTFESIELGWNLVPDAGSYHWEIGLPGFTPGIGASAFIGNTAANAVQVNGLGSDKPYEAYVRGICGNEGTEFAGPVAFSTLLSCGSSSYDTGGPVGDYGGNEDYYVLLCPETPSDTMSLVFNFFETQACCDFLEILDGKETNSPSLGLFSGNALPGAFSSGDASGCLLLHFTSDASVHRGGWAADMLCGALSTHFSGNFGGKVEAFPNPVLDLLNIRYDAAASETVAFSLSDVTGRTLQSWQETSAAGVNLTTLEVANLPSGVYLLTLKTPQGMAALRVLKD